MHVCCNFLSSLLNLKNFSLLVCKRNSGQVSGDEFLNCVGHLVRSRFWCPNTTFFIQGSMAAVQTLSTMMDIFSDFSGLRLNRAKLTFVGFGLSVEETCGCSRILETPIGALPIRYLGVPLVDRRLRIQEWQPVLEKVETRLGGWRARILSCGGRLVLLKAVLAAIPIYYMSIFRMPAGVRRRLEKTIRNFFWRGSQKNHGGRHSSHGL